MSISDRPKRCHECEVMFAPACTLCGVVNCPGCGGGWMVAKPGCDEALKQFIDDGLVEGVRAYYREHPEEGMADADAERWAREILAERSSEWRCLDHRCCVDSPECECGEGQCCSQDDTCGGGMFCGCTCHDRCSQ